MNALSNLIDAGIRLLPFMVLFLCLSLAAKRSTFWSHAWAARHEIKTNMAIWIFDILFVLPIVLLPAIWLTEIAPVSKVLTNFWIEVPIILTIIATVLAGDFISYWRHRLEHCPILWPSHAVHHSDTAFNWFTLYRMHPVNRFTTVTIDTLLLALLGFPPTALIANALVRNAWGSFIHADLPWRLGLLGAIFISPVAHRVHHIDDSKLAGHNFATVFTFWDRWFGTWLPGEGFERCSTGVDEGSRKFIGEMARPIEALIHACKRQTRDPANKGAVGTDAA